ncbi:TPA: hypothetical protein NW717_002150 [Acinetobacter baumannii]|uniref:hypothetical protein n=1 Tax=Acinetobacter baumannii TaxID=470 RepID=UPI000450F91C|nr:hypothetical protein [Acinetobacter baumannii]EXR22239.1 hypothetical protein J669_1125 [Acinetobacter baumannii 1295549]EXR91310.1 hypothetical protein J680_1805 [Acinetobacter baumannii 277047]EXS38781.1 hypothetical protein J677_1102 [Acinetobacter baumannii 426863]MCT9255589.1 hypothetical protein [Acinetobacter baumannii]TPU91448.1 hypothetical protein FJV26_18830 [Acinetobacter baumannii]
MSKFTWDTVISISIFDHWLSEVEADQSNIICYEISLKNNSFDEYLNGEEKFLNFYYQLFDEYSFKDNKKIDFDEYKTTVIQSLREHRLMDMYVQNGRIRLQGGFDRTDQLFLANRSLIPDIMKKLEISKLHVLETMSYENYLKLT